MAKNKTVFVCQNCGYESGRWLGKCPECGEWNRFAEEFAVPESKKDAVRSSIAGFGERTVPILLSDVPESGMESRISSGIAEADRVLGGGFVKGSMTLVGGDPGIGKSTLILQICGNVGKNSKILYVSGEESVPQIKLRADRLKIKASGLKLLSENSLAVITAAVEKEKPDFLVIDSIQTVYDDELGSSPGSVGQVREVTGALMKLAKGAGITTMIIGHVTKEGSLAGPRVLEHMVDTVLYFEGERHLSYRILRGVKNRFGSTNEIGIFEMTADGLEEVENPSSFMLSGCNSGVPGSAVVCGIEGSRPILTEIQALVCKSAYGIPKRNVTGMDFNRVGMLIAVIEKILLLPLWENDVYVNIAGGIRINEPACDLGTIAAIVSSMNNKPLPLKTAYCGEVGLTGEVRAVSNVEKRTMESGRVGYKRIYIPRVNFDKLKQTTLNSFANAEIIPVATVADIFS